MAEARNKEQLLAADARQQALKRASADELRLALDNYRKYQLSLCDAREIEEELRNRGAGG